MSADYTKLLHDIWGVMIALLIVFGLVGAVMCGLVSDILDELRKDRKP